MPRTKEQNEAIRNQRKKLIIDFGVNEYQKKGVRGFEMQEVAKAADIGKGTLYHYYKTKEELLKVIFKKIIDDSKKTNEVYLLTEKKAMKRLEEFIRHQIIQSLENPNHYRFFKNTMEDLLLVYPNEEAEKIMVEQGGKLYAPVVDTIVEAISDGDLISINPWTIAQILWWSLVGASTAYIPPPNIKINLSMVEDIMMVLFNGIKTRNRIDR